MGKKSQPAPAGTLSQALSAISGKVKLALPKLPSLTDLKSLAGTVKEKVAAMREIQTGVGDALKYLADVKTAFAKCEDNLERKVLHQDTNEGVLEMEQYLQNVLALEGYYRSAAALAYLRTVFSRQYGTYPEAVEMLDDLVAKKLLAKATRDDQNTLLVRYDRCIVSPGLGLDEEEKRELTSIISNFSRTLMAMEGERRREKTQQMAEKSIMSVRQLMTGSSTGLCFMHIPPESFLDHGVEKWRGGGDLLVRATSKIIIPADASGSIEGLVTRMGEIDLQLDRYTLGWSTPPGTGKSFDRVKKAVQDELRYDEEMAEEYVRKLQSFWYLLQRGARAARENDARSEMRAEMEAKAEISAAHFYGLNGSKEEPEYGTAFLEFRGTFRHQEESIFAPFFLAKRNKTDQGDFVELVEIPDHLQNFLGQYMGRQFPMQNIHEMTGLLGRLLRAIRSQQDMAAATKQ